LAEQQIERYQKLIQWATGANDLKGKDVADIGCGFGISSCAAFLLSAKSVTGFDIDSEALAFSKDNLWALRAHSPNNWKMLCGSILDEEFISALPRYDLAMAFGVFWMSGNYLGSLENAARLLKDHGHLIFSYNKKSAFTDLKLFLHKILTKTPSWIKIPAAYLIMLLNMFKITAASLIKSPSAKINLRQLFISSFPWWLNVSHMEIYPLNIIENVCGKHGLKRIHGTGVHYQGEHYVVVFQKSGSSRQS